MSRLLVASTSSSLSSSSVAVVHPQVVSYRDRIYIVKDILLKLVEYGELNQTALVSFCGLNLKKHKPILDDLVFKGLVRRSEKASGKRTITFFSTTAWGMEFCRTILEPYEKMFPRSKATTTITTTSSSLPAITQPK
ncbi:MAG TPA: winged helix-turn-helix domain-containing protein [Nitrososphaera sp.]|nr:winged helix-turn-helix domain-containing protein [Nitrososphaera sp.]